MKPILTSVCACAGAMIAPPARLAAIAVTINGAPFMCFPISVPLSHSLSLLFGLEARLHQLFHESVGKESIVRGKLVLALHQPGVDVVELGVLDPFGRD